MIDLNLRKKSTLFKNTESDLLALFYSTGKSNTHFRFSMIDNNFMNFLPYLNDGAIKLYLYYSSVANKDTGESWYSIETISKRLGATDRSISNWNNLLEDLGLIFRTSTGKKSKATFILPLTGFAVKMDIAQINQIIIDLDLYNPNVYTKVFGSFQSVSRLFLKNDSESTVKEILCIHLQKQNFSDSKEINRVNIFIYNTALTTNPEILEKLLTFDGDDKVAIINFNQEIILGKKSHSPINNFYVNDSHKINNTTIYEIMSQLTDDIDISDLTQIII